MRAMISLGSVVLARIIIAIHTFNEIEAGYERSSC